MSGTSTLDDAPLVVFHQCTEAEWKSWGIATANKMAAAGLVVVRVKTEPWQDLKKREAHAFRTPLTADQNEQQMICTIVMRDITCPFLLKVVEDMRNGTLPKNMREWVPSEDLQIVLPPGTEPCEPKIDVVAVTEASSLLAPGVTPAVVRALYRSYSERLVWAGFNGPARSQGSKLVLGTPEDFGLLRDVFKSLLVWHIDQQYLSFGRACFFFLFWVDLPPRPPIPGRPKGLQKVARRPLRKQGDSFVPKVLLVEGWSPLNFFCLSRGSDLS